MSRRPPGNEVSGLSNGAGSIRFTSSLIHEALFGSSATYIAERVLANQLAELGKNVCQQNHEFAELQGSAS
jgi:hypothetical protein